MVPEDYVLSVLRVGEKRRGTDDGAGGGDLGGDETGEGAAGGGGEHAGRGRGSSRGRGRGSVPGYLWRKGKTRLRSLIPANRREWRRVGRSGEMGLGKRLNGPV